jgi:very-short-patch-repair endonuclease
MGLSYQSEHEFPPYAVDVYLGEFHAALEIDGPGHSRTKDAKRDSRLWEAYRLAVLHLPTDLAPDRVKAMVLSFVEDMGPSARERKSYWRERD